MRSRMIREGSVGLLILLGLGLLGGLILWLRGFNPNQRSYRFTVDFQYISGLEVGAPVHYRGVTVGKTVDVRPGANRVTIEVEVKPSTLVIPKDVLIQVVQTGLIGETYVDIIPATELAESALSTNPLAASCNSAIVICHGDAIVGESGASFTELIGSITRFTDLFSNPEIVAEIRTLTRNSANAADGVDDLTREVANLSRLVRQELGQISTATTDTVAAVGQAADKIALTATQVDALIVSNRTAIVSTLDGLNQTTQEIQQIVRSLSPVIQDGELLNNLETLSANAAEASTTLRTLTEAVGSTDNLLLLQQTLDSARATFQNAEKITADLDELTGDPTLRHNLRDLINGMSNLLSTTQQLQQRTQLAYLLNSAEVALQNGETAGLATITLTPYTPFPTESGGESSTPPTAAEPPLAEFSPDSSPSLPPDRSDSSWSQPVH